MDEASSAVMALIENGCCLEDTLDAYWVLVLVQHAQQKPKKAYSTCLSILTLLGEKIPASVDLDHIFTRVYKVQNDLAHKSDGDLLNMKVMTDKTNLAIMQFYCQIHYESYFLKIDSGTMHFFACRLIELCLEHGVSKYSARAFAQFGMMVGGNTVKDTESSYRMGKIALQFVLKFNATDQLPKVYLQYYGYIAIHREPFQSCAEMLRQGHEIGLSVGEFSTAFMNGIHYIQKALIAGANLPMLKKEIEYQTRLIDLHSQSMPKSYIKRQADTIDAIINKRESAQEEEDNEALYRDSRESVLFHTIVRSFWRGHFDRCSFNARKYSESFAEINQIRKVIVVFYHGIASIRSKAKKEKRVQVAKAALHTVQNAAKESTWNYANKVSILRAESHSLDGNTKAAEIAYDAAVESSRASKFIHEQGLACELAGLHYKRAGDLDRARKYLDRAKGCYKEWGSQMKIDCITDQIDMLNGR